MSGYHNEVERRSKVASIDLDTALFHAVDLVPNVDGKVTIAAAAGGYGILLNKPKAGEDASVAIDGECEVRVGAAMQAGDWATSAASGWVVNITSGAGCVVLGRIQTGAASGMLATLELDPFLISSIV
jgi:hypothetical protein